MKKPTNHYIDNEKFLCVLKQYGEEFRSAKELGVELPMVPEYVGLCFIMIANNLALRPNFNNYTFIDEMISDAVENCLVYVNNFNIEKSKNPFAYFTQITYYAFIRRIQKEKRHLHTKYRYIETLSVDDIIRQAHDAGEYETPYINFMKQQIETAFVELAEEEKMPKMKPRRPKYMDTPAASPCLKL